MEKKVGNISPPFFSVVGDCSQEAVISAYIYTDVQFKHEIKAAEIFKMAVQKNCDGRVASDSLIWLRRC